MRLQDVGFYATNGSAHSTELGQNLRAITAFFNHALDALNLSGYAVELANLGAVVGMVMRFAHVYTNI